MNKQDFDDARYSALMHVIIEDTSYQLMGVDFENYAFGIANSTCEDGIEWFKCETCEIPELKVKP